MFREDSFCSLDDLLLEVNEDPLASYLNRTVEQAPLHSGQKGSTPGTATSSARKMKNAYLQKISKLNQEHVIDREKIDYSKSKGESAQDTDDKKKRNRESARKSRKRKNIYMEVLENKVAALTEEIEELKAAIESKNELIRQLTAAAEHGSGGDPFLLQSCKVMDNLGRLLETQLDQHQLKGKVMASHQRLGLGSRERLESIEFYFTQMLDLAIPNFFKFVMLSCLKRSGMFSQGLDSGLQNLPWSAHLVASAEFSPQQRFQLGSLAAQIYPTCELVRSRVQGLDAAKSSLVEASRQLSKRVGLLTDMLSGRQLGTLMLGADRNKYRREMWSQNLLDNLLSLIKKQQT